MISTLKCWHESIYFYNVYFKFTYWICTTNALTLYENKVTRSAIEEIAEIPEIKIQEIVTLPAKN